jgi:hypothetical protein
VGIQTNFYLHFGFNLQFPYTNADITDNCYLEIKFPDTIRLAAISNEDEYFGDYAFGSARYP